MIHYHGTPCSGTRDEVAKFLRSRHALIPFGHSQDVAIAAKVCKSFVIDNGAFSAWRSGEPIRDWRSYYDFVERWRRHQAFAWAIIPDVIDGDEESNDDLLAEWPFSECGVPVWHLHESLERLDRLCRSYDRVALGSSGEFSAPGNEGWWERIGEAMALICDDDGWPRAKLHGLRMLDPQIFESLPLSSADSTNAVRNGNRKAVECHTSTLWGMSIIADRIEQHQSAAWVPRNVQTKLFKLERQTDG